MKRNFYLKIFFVFRKVEKLLCKINVKPHFGFEDGFDFPLKVVSDNKKKCIMHTYISITYIFSNFYNF